MTHQHAFPDGSWPFSESSNSIVYSTKNIVANGFPILTIAHDHEGDWQFLCGMTDDPDDMSIVCFGCMFERHPMIAQFSDLPRGQIAWREDESCDWEIDVLPVDEE